MSRNLSGLAADRRTGDWHIERTDAWHTALGPAAAAAWLWRLSGDPMPRDFALATLDHLSVELQRPFSRIRGLAHQVRLGRPPSWSDRAAIEAGSTLGWIMLALEGAMDTATLEGCRRALVSIHRSLERNGNFHYYINGNYQIPLVELAWWWQRYLPNEVTPTRYRELTRLMVSPEEVAPRWRGYGWVWQRCPEDARWHDGVGYFSEVPAPTGPDPAATFDSEYTQLQVDRMARLWLATGDESHLRFIHSLLNAIEPVVDRSTWVADFRVGTRRSRQWLASNAGYAVSAMHDPRPDIDDDMVRSQIRVTVLDEYRRMASSADPYLQRGYGSTLLTLMIASSEPLLRAARASV